MVIFAKEHLIPQPVFMICILQKHVSFSVLLLWAPFHTITPVSHAEQTDW